MDMLMAQPGGVGDRGISTCNPTEPARSVRLYVLGGMGFAHFVAGRYSEAVEWADRGLREQPRFFSMLRVKAASYAHLGRIEEARDCLKQLLDLQPGLTIAGLKTFWAEMLMASDIVDAYVEGFRKAGLPKSEAGH